MNTDSDNSIVPDTNDSEKENNSEGSDVPLAENESALVQNKFMRAIKTYVLRAGRMTENERKNYSELRQKWCIPFENKSINFTDVFGNTNPITIEIGFGMGHATAIIAAENPNINYLGMEVHKPGVGRLLGEIKRQNISNLYIIEYDALEAIETMVPDNSVNAFHIFFPDPWPKKKHHKRRLVQRPHTDLLERKLAYGGYIYMATDWQEYADSALEELTATPLLKNKYEGFAPHQDWRPMTRFEEKGLAADHLIHELFFEKTEE